MKQPEQAALIHEKEEIVKIPLADFAVLLRLWKYIRDLDEEIS